VSWESEVQDVEEIREVTPFELEAFRCSLVNKLEQHRAEHFPRLPADPITVKRGRKYTRFFKGTSIYCFIVMATGEILMPATWKKPAKHARGSIHNAEPLKCCGPYGVAYLR
jgi:hypothetical protein